ncbi:hypothetical protein JW935_25935, partial [candidate division KSB1 bacterium]|nr:hypothetical protein [candidate division KSB1 bacterium]
MRKFVVLTFFVVITACSERDVPNPVVYRSAPALAKYKIPAFLNPGREYTLSVSAQTSGIEQKVDSVRLEVFKKGESTALFFYVLYDDGQAVHENDGDVVAFDGIFSQKLTWNPATAMREKYMFVFSAADDKGRSSEPLQIEVVSLDNVSPVIVDATGPDSLLSGFDGRQLFEIVAIDSNGTDDILGATFRLERDQTVYTQGPMESQLSTTTYDSGLVAFSLAVDSSFAAGLSGRYDLVFEVTDRSDVVSLPYKKESYLENKAPVVFNLEAASTVEKPKTG